MSNNYTYEIKQHIQEIFDMLANERDKTVSLGLQLTTKCMNDCSYCGSDRHDRVTEINFDLLKSYIVLYKNHAIKLGKNFSVGLDGADNFLYSHFDELVQWLFDNNIVYYIKCNASTLTKDRADRLLATNCDYILITVCGDSKVHDSLRGLDTYDMVCKKTKMAVGKGLKVVWNLTVGSFNIVSIYSILKEIPSMGLDGFSENRLCRSGLANNTGFKELSPIEWRAFLKTLLALWILIGDDRFPLEFRDTLWVPLLVEEGLLDLSKFQDKGNSLGCDLDTNYACVSVDGHIKGCLTLEAAAKEVNARRNIIKFFPSDKASLFFTSDIQHAPFSVCKECDYYRFCRGCAAITLANTGNINNQDPQCWVGR